MSIEPVESGRNSKKILIWLLIFSTLSIPCHAYVDEEYEQNSEKGLRRALSFIQTLQRNGGWAMAWAADGSCVWGERFSQSDSTITVQYPATPGIAMVFLRAYEHFGEKDLLQPAVQAGDALIAGQLECGGFPHEFVPGEPKSKYGTLGKYTTQGAALFLLRLWKVTEEERFKQAALRCAEFFLQAQYRNGGWPQEFPLRDDSSQYITLHDDAMMDAIRTLLKFHQELGDLRYREAAIRGADALLFLRSAPPQAGWAQQYTVDGKPAPARKFVPAALSSYVSNQVLKLFLEVYHETGDQKYLEAGIPVFEWLQHSRLPNGLWAKFYDLQTNEPLYCTEDGSIVKDLKLASDGYSWQGPYYNWDLLNQYKEHLANRDESGSLARRATKKNDVEAVATLARLDWQALDEQGRWLTPMDNSRKQQYQKHFGPHATLPLLIESSVFVRNASHLLNYLKAAREHPHR